MSPPKKSGFLANIKRALILLVLMCTVFSTVIAPITHAAPAAAGAATSGQGTATPPKVPCAIEQMGWLLCPVLRTFAIAAGHIFQALANNFLQTEVSLFSDSSGTETAWETSRNIANVMFVIAFIIIVYSQVTGAGLSNYGIKRMLPRLIIAAILVNVSYYICQLMVDISNILGYNIKTAMDQIAQGMTVMPSPQGTDTQTGDGFLGHLTIAALALAGFIWFILAMLSGTLLMVLITCVTIVVILLLRKAFIVLLIVASPIAFVAYLLPNTEKYFQKWLHMFWELLMVFPVVALLLGGGGLASRIILKAGTQNLNCNQTADSAKTAVTAGSYATPGDQCVSTTGGDCSNNANNNGTNTCTTMTLGLVATGVAVAPLIAVWAVLKGALAAAGAIGGKIAGMVQKGGEGTGRGVKGLPDKAKNAAKFAARHSNTAASIEAALQQREANRKRKRGTGVADIVAGDGKRGALARRVAGRGAEDQQAFRDAAQSQLDHERSEERNRAASSITKAVAKGISPEQAAFDKLDLSSKEAAGSVMTQAAADMLMSTSGGMDRLINKMVEAENEGNEDVVKELKGYLSLAHPKVKEKSGALDSYLRGKSPSMGAATEDINSFKNLSDTEKAGQTYNNMLQAMSTGALDSATIQRLLTTNAGKDMGGAQRALLQGYHNTAQTQNISTAQFMASYGAAYTPTSGGPVQPTHP